MKTRQSVIVLIAACLSAIPAFAQQGRFDNVEYTVTDFGHGIYMLAAAGGNIGLSVGEDGAFLIDDQYAPLTPKLLVAIAGITDKPVRFVINTHWHGDHTGGNANLAETGTVVVAHDNVRSRMAAPGPQQATGMSLPVVTFSDTTTYHLNGHVIHAFHVAHAHTDGDAVIHIANANILHAGDILFNGLYPFIDLDSGGSVGGFIAAMERLVALADGETRIIAGHGPAGNRADVEKSIAMVREARARVAKLVSEGKSLEEVLAIDPFAEFHADWAWAFIDGKHFTETLYRDCAG